MLDLLSEKIVVASVRIKIDAEFSIYPCRDVEAE
jgi:hypothetical protein